MTDILRALSDPGRVRMIEVLADGELHSTNLSEFPLEVQKSTLSHHFKTLREAGITFTRFEGRNCFVQLRKADLDSRFPGLLDALLSPTALADINRPTPSATIQPPSATIQPPSASVQPGS